LANGKPFDWEGQTLALLESQPSQRRGEFRTQRHSSTAFIFKVVQLIGDFLSSFANVEIFVFQHREIDLFKSKESTYGLEFSEKPVLEAFFFWEEVPSTSRRVRVDHSLCLGGRAH